ncbi:hypothetical protein GCM10009426_21500 [Rheinheimera tangshanensis]|nr:hypothetical protein GCM10010920_23120 [Rheinheimera tangshanensis]
MNSAHSCTLKINETPLSGFKNNKQNNQTNEFKQVIYIYNLSENTKVSEQMLTFKNKTL